MLSLARLIERRPRSAAWRSLAAGLALLALGGAGGWFAHAVSLPPAGGIAALAREASDSYAVFGPDHLHPVEFKAVDSAALVSWVSQRLQRPVAVPDLAAAGYRFMGGRLVATPHGAAGLFMYDDDRGTRLVMLVRPMAIERDTQMAAHSQGALSGFSWADKGIGYSLVGPASPQVLHPLADDVRRQIDKEV